jgi:transposase
MEKGIIEKKIKRLLPLLDEKQKRIYLATEAEALGHGVISQVSRITGVSRTTITQGKKEIERNDKIILDVNRVRRKGGGRKKIGEIHTEIEREVLEAVEAHTLGSPESALLYTNLSLRNIQAEVGREGIEVSAPTIAKILRENDYSLQGDKKDLYNGEPHPDRNEQFEYINEICEQAGQKGNPVISIDTKKKENIGNFKNNGQEYHKKGEAPKVFDHDFPIKELGKAAPYGVYDVFKNSGFVNVGLSADTAEFAVNSIRKWWEIKGQVDYLDCDEIVITADCGGSNGYRTRLWKAELQNLANELDKKLTVVHYPPGTSKWNKIEHRMFSFISMNWRGRPLESIALIVSLIGSTKNSKGLTVDCVIDNNTYQKGIQVSDEIFESVNILKHNFHGEWNYSILPKSA